jgi:hypothetical protein
MKKIIFIAVLLFYASSALASSNSLDRKARKIAAADSNLRPPIVKLAIKAFYRAKAFGVPIKKHIMTAIDYSLPATKQRLWVIDLENDRIIHSSLVAHGQNSGVNYTTQFSNQIGSHQTSLGLFLTQETYFGREGYSLRINGLEKGFNDNARTRTIVIHGSPYVSERVIAASGRIGRSWGCPAVEKQLAKPIIDTIKDGSLVFSYFPEEEWLEKSEFVGQKV